MSTLREPYRIRPLLQTLEELWKLNPDQRFFQFVANLPFLLGLQHPEDPYFIEDDELLAELNEKLRNTL